MVRTLHVYVCLQSELTTKGHEVIALKSEIRDLLQKLESKERRIRELEKKRSEVCGAGGDGGNRCDDQLASDKLCSFIERLNQQVRCPEVLNRVRWRNQGGRGSWACDPF